MTLKEKNQKSFFIKVDLLKAIELDPNKYKNNKEILLAVSNQSGIAKLSDISLGVTACSLNTLKSISEELLIDGFDEFEKLRKKVKGQLEEKESETSVSTTSRAGLKIKNNQLIKTLNDSRKDNLMLAMMVTELRTSLKSMAKNSKSTELMENFEFINKKVIAKLALVQTLLEDTTVMEIPNELIDSVHEQVELHLSRLSNRCVYES